MPHKRTIPRVCKQCGSDFLAEAFTVNRGQAIFCGRPCESASRRPLLGKVDAMADGSLSIPLAGRGGTIVARAIIDAADADNVVHHVWFFDPTTGYAYCKTKDHETGKWRNVRLHRALLGLSHGDGMEGDHIDRDRLNCRRSNLRSLPKGKNRQNVPSYTGSTSEYRGVSWVERLGKWRVQIQVDGKYTDLGLFVDETQAAEVARAARAALMPHAVD